MNPPDGATLLGELSAFIRRFVSLSQAQADICALWIIHTHAIDATDFTPYLNITSPVRRSGKTILEQLLSMLVAKPWLTGRVTAAVLVRKTDKDHPTLLLDESDTAFQANREYSENLRGVLNTGYERGGTHSMCVPAGNNWAAKDFSTFCPKAIAGIGRLPDTVEDRSIPMQLKRKLAGEECEHFRKRKVQPQAEDLRARVANWVNRRMPSLRCTVPEMPSELNDRQQDVCEPLVTIADIAGDEWPRRSRQALVALLAAQRVDDLSLQERLLADIRSCFKTNLCEIHNGQKRIETRRLLDEYLTCDEGSPWAEFRNGQKLTAAQLALLLKPFEIRPRDLRFTYGVFKGYEQKDFEDAWSRYLPPPSTPGLQGQQGQQASVYAGSSDFSHGQQAPSVAPSKSEKSPTNMRVVAGVAPAGLPRDASEPGGDIETGNVRDGPSSAELSAASVEAVSHVCKHKIRKR
jgi:hypothetical protein